MATLYELKRNKNRYENLLNRLEIVVKRLNSAKVDLNQISLDIENYYSKDGAGADKKNINLIKKEISDMTNHINGNIKRNILDKIYKLSLQIKNFNEE